MQEIIPLSRIQEISYQNLKELVEGTIVFSAGKKKKGLGKPKRLTTLGEHSKTKATRELEKQIEEVLRKIQERK